MSEFRVDPISGDYIIIASERAERPQDFKNNNEVVEVGNCPFCIGNEKMTPPSIIEHKDNNDNWDIRVIPNKYPFVSENKEEIVFSDNFYSKTNGYGIHDVLIDTPNHNQDLSTFTEKHMQNVFLTLQTRQKQIEQKENIKYVQIFKNQGTYAGASKAHSHWQIVGIPIITEKQLKLLKDNKQYTEQKGICGYCDIIKHELECKERLIDENNNFIAIAPYASKYPYEIWILPKTHYESFLQFDTKELANLFQKVIKALNLIFPNINFNICFQGVPNLLEYKNIHHWHLQIIPRLSGIAGFELGTSCYINIFPPELVAKNLKENLE